MWGSKRTSPNSEIKPKSRGWNSVCRRRELPFQFLAHEEQAQTHLGGRRFRLSRRTGTPGSQPGPPPALTTEIKKTSRWPFPSSAWQWQYFPLNGLHTPRALGGLGWSLQAPSGRLRATPSSSRSSGPAGTRRPGSAPGLRGACAGNQEPGTRRPDLCTGHHEHGSVRVRHSEVTAGKEDRAVGRELEGGGLPSSSGISYKLRMRYGGAVRDPLRAQNRGHRGWPRRVCSPRSPRGPASCVSPPGCGLPD